ncbi:hypothetical protein GGQ80_001890 [Sphingomonas jinjuensis]|uniref:Uncharacterized protein n=1 Tax=Sphingomonas jinjuensis TaxID=535907 RepID=A0A840FE16_9SPHN|nr:hypothetical protein [Sphingomonas jinjuensis]MBB4153984.1 hypothetical protein [Sphingomonas jinjuensis]
MRIPIVLAACIGALSSGAAIAQEVAPGRALAAMPVALVYPSTAVGSPSNATATVSPSAIPAAMERSEPADRLSLSLGALFASGDFGANANTSIQSYALGVRARTGNWRFTGSLPWMRIESNATFFTGIDSTPVLISPRAAGGRSTARGFGDLTLGTSYSFAPGGGGTELEVSGRVKLDTASRNSLLSSGERDYALGLQAIHPIGRFAPFASVTYRMLGDIRDYQLRDGFAASAGSSMSVGSRGLLLASYHYARAATNLVEDSHELFGGASIGLADSRFRLTAFATAGLSRGAAAVSSGAALSRSF